MHCNLRSPDVARVVLGCFGHICIANAYKLLFSSHRRRSRGPWSIGPNQEVWRTMHFGPPILQWTVKQLLFDHKSVKKIRRELLDFALKTDADCDRLLTLCDIVSLDSVLFSVMTPLDDDDDHTGHCNIVSLVSVLFSVRTPLDDDDDDTGHCDIASLVSVLFSVMTPLDDDDDSDQHSRVSTSHHVTFTYGYY